MIRAGLIGAGIGPSLSPALHEREAAALGVPLRYRRWDLDALGAGPADVGGLLDRARAEGYHGLNITHPCKQLVIGHLDALAPDAAAIGAVNTVVIGADGSFTGHNTDWTGFRDGLREGLPGTVPEPGSPGPAATPARVVLLGAGGAGAAAGYALVRAGVRHLHVVDVDDARAAALADALVRWAPAALRDAPAAPRDSPAALRDSPAALRDSPAALRDAPAAPRDSPAALHGETAAPHGDTAAAPVNTAERCATGHTTGSIGSATADSPTTRITAHGRGELDHLLPGADGLVHATPVGMAAHPGLPFDAALLASRPWVAEIVYRPLDTALLRAARAAGCRTVDGGRMAVHQAAEAFRLFTGHTPDPARMLAHLAELVATEETSHRVA